MVWRNKYVDMSCVDTTDDTYRITTRTDLEDLLPSIDELGIMNPPFLTECKNGKFGIVCGFRRISAAEALEWKGIYANILNPETPPERLAMMAIADNAFQRSLNLIEQSRSIQLLKGHLASFDQLSNTAVSLQLPGNPKMINTLCAISKLPEAVHQSLLANTVSLPVALMLLDFSSEDIHHVVTLFNTLQLNLNIQREIMTLVTEIAKIENQTIANVVKNEAIQGVILNPDMEKPLKTQKIRRYLKQKRFPEIFSAEDRFKKNINALKLDKHTKLIPPKFFEGMNYSINLSFKSMEALEKRRAMLDSIIRNPVMMEILKKK